MNTRPVKNRFLDKIKYVQDCWIWIGTTRGHMGYGAFHFNDKMEGAHRASFNIFNGPITPGSQVLHTCDNPKCVNPKHLFLGTNQDNVNDKMAKGRHVATPVYGINNHLTKFTTEIVEQIRELSLQYSQKELSHLFNMSQPNVSRIIRNVTRKIG